ncbi:type II toxin-antitoxin system VapB family antitoxin [Nocardioides nitrophenolicus]|uniref:type II toxin-antitoxin system VapB family antitoxin n=1 Tax=Nocardioides nitrophenolicus TaxID=60489 RepID=UPI000B0D4F79|nr:type II toxin-antitoxin system VapB family antitoxin [Nocardioides nitrophenolicus]MBM7517239.1 antitoxin VapB [Nocardioides nitrophenolicus]
MSLNIKNERVHALAREAARITGKSQTSVIEEALVKLLAEYGLDPVEADRKRRMDAVTQIALEWQDLPVLDGEDRIREVEDLYDTETGLPV